MKPCCLFINISALKPFLNCYIWEWDPCSRRKHNRLEIVQADYWFELVIKEKLYTSSNLVFFFVSHCCDIQLILNRSLRFPVNLIRRIQWRYFYIFCFVFLFRRGGGYKTMAEVCKICRYDLGRHKKKICQGAISFQDNMGTIIDGSSEKIL